eukprot:UN01488
MTTDHHLFGGQFLAQDSKADFSEGKFKVDKKEDAEIFCNLEKDFLETHRNHEKGFCFRLRFPDIDYNNPSEVQVDNEGNNVTHIIWQQTNSLHEDVCEGFEGIENDVRKRKI